jgi:hypothetical protein
VRRRLEVRGRRRQPKEQGEGRLVGSDLGLGSSTPGWARRMGRAEMAINGTVKDLPFGI